MNLKLRHGDTEKSEDATYKYDDDDNQTHTHAPAQRTLEESTPAPILDYAWRIPTLSSYTSTVM